MSAPLSAGWAAVAMTAAARMGDRAAVSRLLAQVHPSAIPDLVFTLAASADPPRARREDRSPVAAHAAFKRMKSRGLSRAEMPAWVANGERVYNRAAKQAQLARRQQAQEAA